MTTAETPVSVTQTQTILGDEAEGAHHQEPKDDQTAERKETLASPAQNTSSAGKQRPSRRRGMTITQATAQLQESELSETEEEENDTDKAQPNIDSAVDVHNYNGTEKASDMEQVQDQIKDLLVNDTLEDNYDDETISSVDDASSSPRSHHSTVSSLHSSASNYDLLLARLGNKNNDPVPTIKEEAVNEAVAEDISSGSSKAGKIDEPTEKDIDWEFWSKVIFEYSSFNRAQKDMLSDHIRHGGVPPSLRGAVWQQLAKSKDTALEQQYLELLTKESIYEKAITRDLGRTFTNNEYFQSTQGREALFNVVKAYSLYDEQVGYSHGVAFIAGPLLLNMPEEEAFSVLVRLMQNYGLRYHFTTQPDHLSRRLYQLTCLIEDHLPLVHKHISAQGIHASKFATRWFVTLFAYNFPLDTVYRIYDAVLAEGLDFTFRIILVLLEKFQAQILSLESEHLVHFLKSDMLSKYADADGPGLIYDAYQVGITPRRLDRLAKQYQSDAARASSEAETIETLRRQNKALSEAVRQLEKNLDDMNREHNAAANELIESKMEYARLHDENDALRQQSYDLKRALETLPSEVENRVKEEMRVLSEKNKELVQRNTKLEEQLAYLENIVIEMNAKFAESENERENLKQRLAELKKLVG